MRERLVKSLIGIYFRERITNPKNSKNRENPQERRELVKFLNENFSLSRWNNGIQVQLDG